ncbi:hypothetical protein SBF1_2360018 [Candidatus Desulfosporosinus infrequens]|uniref:Uncharacterized protein n=1 Tax=Candidatus Desulfosporosinus infrequens TaxID=2043169 RepID=A0A2U3KMG7_9FIRM|nr:hypothetical protein SBF1_2360018 [Candidatus Desulfosporosinus infrequens]
MPERILNGLALLFSCVRMMRVYIEVTSTHVETFKVVFKCSLICILCKGIIGRIYY